MALPIEIPALDLSAFLPSSGTDEERAAVAATLDDACSSVGFFYVCLPGLAEAAERLLERCREFHALSVEVKRAVSSERRGYNETWKTGGGSCAAKPGVDPPDPKSVFRLGSEGDSSPMHMPNVWPDEGVLPGWRAALEQDRAIMLTGARTVALALAAALGEPADAFGEAMRDPAANMILLQYDTAHVVSGRTGCGAHTDCGFLTLLAQEFGGGALQVQRGAVHSGTADSAGAVGVDEAAWVEAPPREGHVLVNLGDMVARWTNGRYRSTIHRVMLDTEKPHPQRRHSVAFFANPTFTTPVECFPSCCSPTPGMPPAQFEPITAGKYIFGRLGLTYKDDSCNTYQNKRRKVEEEG